MSRKLEDPNPRRRRGRAAALLAAGLAVQLAVPRVASAHNGDVHRDIVDLAYQVARWTANERMFPPASSQYPIVTAAPAGVDATQWNQFLLDVSKAVGQLAGVEPVAITSYKPGGVFNELAASGFGGTSPSVGRALGDLAAAVDGNHDDSHLWIRPTSALGLGEVKKIWEKAWKTAVGSLLVPFVCGYELIFGGDDCVGDAGDLASEADVVTKIEGLIPGIGDISGDPFTTVWHFINVQESPLIDNEFDDRQGLYYLQAGWFGPALAGVPQVDPVDLAIYVFSSATGLSIDYDGSDGPKHYEITAGNDFHRDTKHRSKSLWQALPLGLTALEPVDNLGKYGWDRFRADAATVTGPKRFENLKFPLHAIGDACAPHHVIGVTGWGHRPYEDAEAQLWPRLRQHHAPVTDDAAAGGERAAQLAQAKRILARAFTYRQDILAWRAAHGRPKTDVPVRDLVTRLAIETRDVATAAMGLGLVDAWPFDVRQSMAYALGDAGAIADGLKYAAITYYHEHAQSLPRMRDLVERGVAMTLAFLVSAVEA